MYGEITYKPKRHKHTTRRYCSRCNLTRVKRLNCPKCDRPLIIPHTLRQNEILERVKMLETNAKYKKNHVFDGR